MNGEIQQMKRVCVCEDRLWNKVILLGEKYFCVRVLSFIVTIEWGI